MLRHLSIRDFVVVDTLDLEFDPGFTVFSGETGAGKSILIDALALTLGARGDASVVRTGQARADITAGFATYDAVDAWLAAQALEGEPGTVLLRRVIDAGGRSRAFINGTAATLAQLRDLGDMLVEIHGQHAHQLLMRADAQRDLFDTHAGLGALAADTARAWRAVRDANAAIEAAVSRDREIQLERERLAWQLAELDKLKPQPGEWEEINVEHRRLSNAANLIGGVQAALGALSESDDAMLHQLTAVIARLRDLADLDAGLADALAALEPAEIQIQEAVYSLNHYAQRLDLDPDRLAEVDQRLDALHSAARKFRLQPESLPDEHTQRRAQLDALDAAADLDALRAAEAAAQRAYQDVAKRLSKERARHAKALGEAVTTGMQELSMAGGQFEVALVPQPQGGPHGLEQIEFRVAGHAGVPLRPLAKVASGGELARISLALSVIASAASPTPTLIFDEVDTGIGGAVAEVVGRLLHQLGRMRQVLCVTHLPQVAARGEYHFKVAKKTVDAGTVSSVDPLDKPSRVEEIARMLGGVEITATTRKHAREMLAA
ncbi:DNA repair protein RecN [Pararobbsia silviterrae]|uniref:DNA repair protein RecN n=1 Tax=Pararobbsia silviterrae TaxID=1792498 RepID=A0A494XDA6_9BURK|nr:DNA repair protein RecN [Pararobbsia silviterrae]RKP48620.1 DNA repair protein RecN [Pararobbsia silviterrae]